jgi:phospholipase/lecithinase/hemolysin
MASRVRVLAQAFSALSFFVASASAGPIHSIYAFGDSLTDVGNVFAFTGNTIPGPPYVNGQFSNGPVWVQYLATGLGLNPLSPSLAGGTDYAYGTAESGTTVFHAANAADLTGPAGQLAQYQSTHATSDPTALYTIWIGSNDLGDIPAGATNAQIAADIGAIVSNIDSAIVTLALSGAKNFLLVTVPDLGKAPAAIAAGPIAQATASALSATLNGGLVPTLGTLQTTYGLNLKILDSYSLVDSLVSNPGAFGFTDVVDPCVTGAVNYVGGTACAATLANQNKYLFWDLLHPTTAGHEIIGSQALADETPEPSSIVMAAGALFAISLLRRRLAARRP